MPSPHPVHFFRATLVLCIVNCQLAPAVAALVTILDNVGRFSIIDTDTGIAETKAFGLGGYANLAFNSADNLYYTTDSQNMLRTITESGSVSNPIGQLPQLKGLTFDQTGSLFGYDFSSDQLLSIDRSTALYTVLGSSGFVLDGPGNQLFDTGSNLIVVMDQFGQGVSGLLDRITGTGTTLFTNDDLLGKQILGFANSSGSGNLDTNLYLSDSISLYTLDLSTGAVAKGYDIQYESCTCVPEPSTFVLFGATFVLPFLRKKRRKVLSRLPSLTSLGGLSASAQKRFQRFFMSPHFMRLRTRRVVLESLEPRMVMTGAYQCDAGDYCLCNCNVRVRIGARNISCVLHCVLLGYRLFRNHHRTHHCCAKSIRTRNSRARHGVVVHVIWRNHSHWQRHLWPHHGRHWFSASSVHWRSLGAVLGVVVQR